MSAPPTTVATNEIAFFFNTNEPIPAAPLIFFISEVDRIARNKGHFGPDILVELLQVETGTKLVKLSINQKIATGALAVAAWQAALHTGEFALDIYDRFHGENRLARCVAEMCVDNGVTSITTVGPDGSRKLEREAIPAVERLRTEREVQQGGERAQQVDYLTDERGHTLTTENGEPLVVESPRQEPEDANRRLANVGADWARIPRAELPPGGSMKGNFVGSFASEDPPFYTFRSDTGEVFEVRGIGVDIGLPTGIRLVVRGAVSDTGAREALFYPERIMKVGTAE